MANLKLSVMSGIAMILLSGYTFAEDISRQRAVELTQECQSERERNIAPLKEQAIDDCINNKKKGQDYCERYYRAYGQGSAGGTPRGMFWDLPVCKSAFEAEKYFRKNPSKQMYSAP